MNAPTTIIGLTDGEVARERLSADVALMRKLGVTEWNGIKLGPEPGKPAAAPRERAPAETPAQRRHRVMFAATSIRPPLPEPDPLPKNTPRAAVLRRKASGAADGDQGTKQEG